MASSTAPQVTPVIRVPSSTAANSGVATTYVPVMKPDTLAGVCASPVDCRIWATPYSSPSTAACRHDSRLSRPSARGKISASPTLAIAKRTARKSSTGMRATRSLMRKNVEPHVAVIASSVSVASREVTSRRSLRSLLSTSRRAATRRTLGHEHDLAAGMAALDVAVRGRRLREREARGDHHLEVAVVGELGQLQPGAVA